jgi:hypothetical protein
MQTTQDLCFKFLVTSHDYEIAAGSTNATVTFTKCLFRSNVILRQLTGLMQIVKDKVWANYSSETKETFCTQ